LPQATIKLQLAPAPAAAARKPLSPIKDADNTVPPAAKSEPAGVSLSESGKNQKTTEEAPLPLLVAAAGLTLVALGIQIWTFYS
jgi:hypothetical protein